MWSTVRDLCVPDKTTTGSEDDGGVVLTGRDRCRHEGVGVKTVTRDVRDVVQGCRRCDKVP